MPEVADLPIWYATVATFILFIAIAASTWLLSADETFSDAPDRSRWRDLRIWATALVVMQLGIYLVFS